MSELNLKWNKCIAQIANNADWILHEDAIKRDIYNVRNWIVYLDAIEDDTIFDFVSKRALAALPRSYKLWKRHWEWHLNKSREKTDRIVALFERALQTLSHMPRVWSVYLEYLFAHETHPTVLRRAITRALQALPVTQHQEKLWQPLLLPYLLKDTTCPPLLPTESIYRLLQRYSQLDFTFLAQLGEWCQNHGLAGRAAVAYQSILLREEANKDDAQQHDVWQAFGELCVQNSSQVAAVGIPWETILRAALQDPNSQKKKTSTWLPGRIYAWLASAWVRRGAFDLARVVYEEGIHSVNTVRDFSLLFDAYLQLEQGLVEHAVQNMEDDLDEEDDNAENHDNDDWDILLESTAASKVADMELALRKAEHLTQRRPLLLNAVLLRQNPMNVPEWLKRAELFREQGQLSQATASLQEALQTVTHPYAGTRSELMVALIQLHREDPDRARTFLKQACLDDEIAMTTVDDLTTCWATWIELELQQEQWDEALSLARQSVVFRKNKPNLTRSLRLWDLLLDLEESLGTVQTCKDAYHRAIEIKAATPQHILHFTLFLKENNYFEEAFSVYEKGIELFSFPALKLIWRSYIKDFLERLEGKHVERTRDLFDRCIESCPPEDCAEFYTQYGAFEEQYGLTKRALNVYRDMCHKVPTNEKPSAYRLYIVKTIKHIGFTATRDIYQEAIETLPDELAALLCIEFAEMETSLQQFERARAIFVYGAQMADPRRVPDYWTAWKEFEVQSGNEETFREMLRVKRSIEVAFSTSSYSTAATSDNAMTEEEAMRMIANQEGDDIAEQTTTATTAVQGFVASSSSTKKRASQTLDDIEESVAKLRRVTKQEAAPDEDDAEIDIDIDDIDAEIEQAAAEGEVAAVENIAIKPVPDAVFGAMASQK